MSGEKADLVLICGPPFSGRTMLYHQKLASSHVRVCPDELYRQNKDLTLRQLVNIYVVAPIKQKKKVAVDDSFQTSAKRVSIINLVRKKIAHVECVCYRLVPSHGLDQLRWASELSMAQEVAYFNNEGTQLRGNANFEAWLHEEEVADAKEGFRVLTIPTDLYAETRHKFEVPALWIQWEGLIQRESAVPSLVDGICTVFRLWYSTNPCGRILIIADGNSSSGVLSSERDHHIQMLMKELVKQLDACPVYVLAVTPHINGATYCGPPEPSLIAFLQQLHCIDLRHPGTMYLFHTPSHMKMAEKAGIKYIKASRVFMHPNLAKSAHSAAQPKPPALLTGMKVVPVHTSGQAFYDETSFGSTEAQVPLYGTLRATQGVGKQNMCPGRVMFVFCRDVQVMESYQDSYRDHATLTASAEASRIRALSSHFVHSADPNIDQSWHSSSVLDVSSVDKNRELPSWMKAGCSSGKSKGKHKRKDASLAEDNIVASPKKRRAVSCNKQKATYLAGVDEPVRIGEQTLGLEVGTMMPSEATLDVRIRPHHTTKFSRHSNRKGKKAVTVIARHTVDAFDDFLSMLSDDNDSDNKEARTPKNRSHAIVASDSTGQSTDSEEDMLTDFLTDRPSHLAHSKPNTSLSDLESHEGHITSTKQNISKENLHVTSTNNHPYDIQDFSEEDGFYKENSRKFSLLSVGQTPSNEWDSRKEDFTSGKRHSNYIQDSSEEDIVHHKETSRKLSHSKCSTSRPHGKCSKLRTITSGNDSYLHESSNRKHGYIQSPRKKNRPKGILFDSSAEETVGSPREITRNGGVPHGRVIVTNSVDLDVRPKPLAKLTDVEVVADSFVPETVTTVPETILSDRDSMRRAVSLEEPSWNKIPTKTGANQTDEFVDIRQHNVPKVVNTVPDDDDDDSILDGLI